MLVQLGQREGREAPQVTPTLLTLTQNVLISALSEGRLHIPQSPALILPPPLVSHGPWDVPWPSADHYFIKRSLLTIISVFSLSRSGAMYPQD